MVKLLRSGNFHNRGNMRLRGNETRIPGEGAAMAPYLENLVLLVMIAVLTVSPVLPLAISLVLLEESW